MSEEENSVEVDSQATEVDDDLFGELDGQDDSEVEKTPSKVEPKPQPKTIPYERFQRINEENKVLRNKNVKGINPMEVVKLAKALEGYSKEEVDFITRNSKSGKIDDIISITEDEWVKDAIDARRKKVGESNKVPGSSSPDFASNQKSPQEIADMDPKARAEYEELLNRESTGI